MPLVRILQVIKQLKRLEGDQGETRLSLEHLQGPFLVFGGGISVAVLAYIAELATRLGHGLNLLFERFKIRNKQ